MGLRRHEGQGCILADEMYAFQSVRLRAITDIQVPGVWGKPFRSVRSFDVVLLVDTSYRQFLLCGHFSVSSLPHMCYNFQAGHRAEPLRWRWASNRQGLDRMPCIAGQCSFLFFRHVRYLLTCEQNWRAEFHKW
jgi:hypothetical protein